MKNIVHDTDAVDEPFRSMASWFFRTFGIGELLHRNGRWSGKGIPGRQILFQLFFLVFSKKNFHELIREKSLPWGKDVAYRFLSSPGINWRRFLLTAAKRIIERFLYPLTSKKRTDVFILDDSLFSRNRSRKVELLSRIFDHCAHRYVKGFRMLTLGWSDGRSFLPLAFSLLGSAKEENRFEEAHATDKRTSGARRRAESVLKTGDVAHALLDAALRTGIRAKYVLFDSWFATNGIILALHSRNLHAVCMIKDFNTMRMRYGGKRMKLGGLYAAVKGTLERKDILGSAEVFVDAGKNTEESPVPARVVFVRNRTEGARRAWLALLTTDMALTNEEVVRIYGKRWQTEVFFKSAKSLLRLAKAFQTRSYDSLTAHTSIVFLRQMMLCCEQRRTTDDRTFGDIFRLCCEELEDISFRTSLGLLLRLLKETVASGIVLSENIIDALFEKFMAGMPRLLRQKLAGDAILSLC